MALRLILAAIAGALGFFVGGVAGGLVVIGAPRLAALAPLLPLSAAALSAYVIYRYAR